MWFSFDRNNMSNMFPLSADQVMQIRELNRHGKKGDSVIEKAKGSDDAPEFVSAVGDDSISRFDSSGRKHGRGRGRDRGRDRDRERNREQDRTREGNREGDRDRDRDRRGGNNRNNHRPRGNNNENKA